MEKEGNNRKMHMVIDIPEKLACEGFERPFTEEEKNILIKAIGNGTPLPKRHGRLGDLDEIKKEMQNYHDDCAKTSEYTRLGFETAIAVVEDAPTIIEADRKRG